MPGEANYDIRMYMDILDEENIQICQHTYTGRITHYGALAFGISSHPLMPTTAKLLLSKKRPEKNKDLAQKLIISKEDIHLLKLYNLFVVL